MVDKSHMLSWQSVNCAYTIAWVNQNGIEKKKDFDPGGESASVGSQQNRISTIDCPEVQLRKDAKSGRHPKLGGNFEEMEHRSEDNTEIRQGQTHYVLTAKRTRLGLVLYS